MNDSYNWELSIVCADLYAPTIYPCLSIACKYLYHYHRFGNPNIVVIKEGTGIKSKRQAVVDCPSTAKSICACDITYKDVHLDDEANTLYLVTDINKVTFSCLIVSISLKLKATNEIVKTSHKLRRRISFTQTCNSHTAFKWEAI